MNIMKAQDTIRTLIISEARIDNQFEAYVELTNVGSTPIDLSKFEFGKIDPSTQPYKPSNGNWFMLPKKMLAPAQSFVIAQISDWTTKMWAKSPDLYNRYGSKPEFLELADLQIHIAESPTPVSQSVDSVSSYASVVNIWNGSSCWYLRHHVTSTDSVVIDQVGGVFDETDGTSQDMMHDVAGLTDATGNAVLIRKASIKKGNTDFNHGRGTNAEESEWIAIPFLSGSSELNRAVFWTVGNHGGYRLNSLKSSTLKFNFDTTTLTVPWGIRNDDSIMYQFNRVPGIAWHYDYAGTRTDSAYVSVRSGDKLTIYACGNSLTKKVLTIIASDPKPTDNTVIPMKVPNRKGFYKGAVAFCEVTDKVPGMDTISGIPFACRKDSLIKYLEIPAKATWKFILLDTETRADLIKGDILAVTSENGATKQYYIKPNRYYPSHDARLSSIIWPDIPEYLRGKMGWKGDTIPGFNSSKTYYKVSIPYDVEGIPALTGITQQVNAKIHVQRAVNLKGYPFERTVTFTVTAEDDTATKTYMVEFSKEKGPCCMQRWKGEPFISEFVFRQDYQNYFCEIVNPSNFYNLDLSNYMLTFGYYANADEAITRMSAADSVSFANRYNKYIPGYKWVSKIAWKSNPGLAIPDPNVNPIISPGDVFVMADIYSAPTSLGYPDFAIPQTDIDFQHNLWGDDLSKPYQTMNQWWGQKIMLFKILNDSVRLGIKPANDPKDFQLIDVFGDIAGNRWVIGGDSANMTTAWIRKPEIYKGSPVIQKSFGTDPQNSEWIKKDEVIESAFLPFPDYRKRVADNVGSHLMNEVVIFNSTITSAIYKVSEGFSTNEKISGVAVGTTVNNFLSNIIKTDTGQHLTIKKATDGTILSGLNSLTTGDSLIVVSSDLSNTTKYVINCTPLSGDAILTSSIYTITVNGSNGVISNFNYANKLKDVFDGVTVPPGASIVVTDGDGAYLPFKILNFHADYAEVEVNDQIRFEVTAENGTHITYRLKPTGTDSDAFVTSYIYYFSTCPILLNFPSETSVSTFKRNVIPAAGATIKILDKNGLERTSGIIIKDDRLVVTAADGITTKNYYFTGLVNPIYYLPSVYSKDYIVNQIWLTISGNIKETLTVGDFLSKLIPSHGTTIKLLNKDGVEKPSNANIAVGDVVEATLIPDCDTSRRVTYYSIIFDPTSISVLSNNLDCIEIYPNPSNGNLYISGLKPTYTILVFNTLGKLVLGKTAYQPIEDISMSDQPKGVYFIKVVSNDNRETIRKMVIY